MKVRHDKDKVAWKQQYRLYKCLNMAWFILLVPLIVSCQKNISIPIASLETTRVHESLATKSHPAEFYLCGNNFYPCYHVTNRWSGHKENCKESIKNSRRS